MLDPLFIWAADISPFFALAVAIGMIASLMWVITWSWSRAGFLAIVIRIVTLPITIVFLLLAIGCGLSIANDIIGWFKGES